MFGMFKKSGHGTSKSKAESGTPIISSLLLERDSFPIDAFLKQVARTRFTGKAASNVARDDTNVVAFAVEDELLGLVLISAPYPAGDLAGPIATSWMWPPKPSIQSVKNHRAHLLVTMIGGAGDPVRRRLIFTAVTALAAKQEGVMAVYWGEATHLIYPPIFVGMAEQIDTPEAPPLYLWVDMRVFRNDDGTTGLFTTGLSPLGHMEIEIPRIHMKPGDLREWLLNIIYYLLENGPVLKDGQTIGMSAEQQIRIRHCPSSFGHPGKVIRLEP